MKDESFFKTIIKYIFHRRKAFLLGLVMTALLAYAVFGKKGLLQRYELDMENSELREKLKNEQDKTIMLQNEIEDLKNSDKEIEKVAREKYGMTKEGEEIYKIVVDSTE